MIIKKINIHSFGKIQDLSLDLSSKLNLIYGENEKGKSTIQSFIKACLYGIPSKKEKGTSYSLRERYSGINGEKMAGELIVYHDGREFIIKRSFGKTKKDDKSEILDALTGEEVKEVDKDEPGKYFLGVNSSTFSKTLFISQLGVVVEKDKEEEIMDKITNIFHSGDDEVSIEKALEILNANIKLLTTVRKVGTLDILKCKKEELINEKFHGYKASEETLDKEERLNKATLEKNEVLKEIENLELYKKYLKKVKLQKEYKEILEYLKKSEELKKQKNEILGTMKKGETLIEEEFLNELNEENNHYLNLLDIKNEGIKDIEKVSDEISKGREIISKYYYFNDFKGDLKEKLLTLKITQQALKEKIMALKNIKKTLENEENGLLSGRNAIPFLEQMEKNSGEIIRKLTYYDEKLRELQNKGKNTRRLLGVEERYKKIKLTKSISLIWLILSGGLLVLSSGLGLGIIGSISGGTVLIISLFIFINAGKNEKEILQDLNEKKEIDELKNSIVNVEKDLVEFGKEVGAKNYEEVIYRLKSYESYKLKEDRLTSKIEAKREELKNSSFEENIIDYEKNNLFIENVLIETESRTIEEVLSKHSEYEKEKSNLILLLKEQENRTKAIERVEYELGMREESIKRKLSELDLSHIDLMDISYYLKELRAKLKKKNEILSSLSSVEQTYSVLIKERDIDEIKDELKEILDTNLNYSYENEEEIEEEIKKRSEKLIELEKEIRDLNNFINNRFIGKREIATIEEDIREVDERIKKEDLRLRALKLAKENMEEAALDIRKNIGPILNKNIAKYMRELSNDSFEEALLGEDYSMQVRKDGKLFPAEFLSNGAKDQLYLALRMSFINHIFEDREYPIFFDDAFVQYDELRREKVLNFISKINAAQSLIFTCQKVDIEILSNNKKNFNYIKL
ncbi:MAG: ATP-binding protein [Clostridium sp.]